jgi:hypothetical protein
MIRLLADENFNRKVVRGVLRIHPRFDVVRAQNVGLVGVPDPGVLAWAAAEGRIVLTHDKKTMPGFVAARLARSEPMPGLFVVDDWASASRVIDDLLEIDGASDHDEWAGQTVYIPM